MLLPCVECITALWSLHCQVCAFEKIVAARIWGDVSDDGGVVSTEGEEDQSNGSSNAQTGAEQEQGRERANRKHKK